jgi:hypothetical protein
VKEETMQYCHNFPVEPVEFLYKSLQEYHYALGAKISTQVYQLFADQEQERSINNQCVYAI